MFAVRDERFGSQSKSLVHSHSPTLITHADQTSVGASSIRERNTPPASSMDNFLSYARTVLSSAMSDKSLNRRPSSRIKVVEKERLQAIGTRYPSNVAGFKPKRYGLEARQ